MFLLDIIFIDFKVQISANKIQALLNQAIQYLFIQLEFCGAPV